MKSSTLTILKVVDGAVLTLSTCFLVDGIRRKVKEVQESYISEDEQEAREQASKAQEELDRELPEDYIPEANKVHSEPRMHIVDRVFDDTETGEGEVTRVEVLDEEDQGPIEEGHIDGGDIFETDLDWDLINNLRKKVNPDMRFNKDSMEALAQYINSRLADVHDRKTIEIMEEMFMIPWNHGNVEDGSIVSNIIDKRIEFFGEGSRWTDALDVRNVCMADLLLYFAEKMDWDYDGGVEHWLKIILDQTGLYGKFWNSLDSWAAYINKPDYKEGSLFGLFQLDPDSEMTKGPDESLMQQFWDFEDIVDGGIGENPEDDEIEHGPEDDLDEDEGRDYSHYE